MIEQIDGGFGERTTFRVGGTAARVLEVDDREDLVDAVRRGVSPPIFVLGRGSNTLVADEGFSGTVVHLGEGFAGIDIDAATGHIVAGGAADLPVVARRSVEAGLTGFEWAVGVPGSIGGATRMNAGGHGSDMAASLVEVTVMDLITGTIASRPAASLDLAYRSSSIAPHEAVLEVHLVLDQGDPATGREQLREIVRWRRAHQPGGANCGSVFTNPPGDSAGRLIEAAGLKGIEMGTASVSAKHANFIQASAGGRADDVARLIDHIIEIVEEREGVRLRSEVKMIGFGRGS
jgi:UDP-N-acetylmuramate dehydrogenase